MILKVLAKALIPASLVLFAGAAFAGDCDTDLKGDGTTDEADVTIFQGTLGKSAAFPGFPLSPTAPAPQNNLHTGGDTNNLLRAAGRRRTRGPLRLFGRVLGARVRR